MTGVTAPKVILIGGPPGAGKTTLGRAIARRLDWPSITVDDLYEAAKAVTTSESHPGFHRMNRPNPVEYFTNGPAERLIEDAIAQSEATAPVVERVVRKHHRHGPGVVIDGWHLRPAWVAGLELPRLASFWIHIDMEVLERRERETPWFRQDSPDPERMLANFLARSEWHNDLIKAEAEKHGLPVIHQDGTLSVDVLTDTVLSADD